MICHEAPLRLPTKPALPTGEEQGCTKGNLRNSWHVGCPEQVIPPFVGDILMFTCEKSLIFGSAGFEPPFDSEHPRVLGPFKVEV
jgi:hypothetical protein